MDCTGLSLPAVEQQPNVTSEISQRPIPRMRVPAPSPCFVCRIVRDSRQRSYPRHPGRMNDMSIGICRMVWIEAMGHNEG